MEMEICRDMNNFSHHVWYSSRIEGYQSPRQILINIRTMDVDKVTFWGGGRNPKTYSRPTPRGSDVANRPENSEPKGK